MCTQVVFATFQNGLVALLQSNNGLEQICEATYSSNLQIRVAALQVRDRYHRIAHTSRSLLCMASRSGFARNVRATCTCTTYFVLKKSCSRFQIVTICCQTSGGFHRVLAVTSQLRIKHEESARFERLVEMLSAQSPLKYQVWLIQFL